MSAIARPKSTEKTNRMSLNVEVGLHYRFKAATAAQGTNMTDVLIKFIRDYVAQYEHAKDKKERS